MANKKVIFIQSVSGSITHPADSALPVWQRRQISLNSGAYSYVVEFEDVVADVIVANGLAIPFDGWETNPKRPIRITFPQ